MSAARTMRRQAARKHKQAKQSGGIMSDQVEATVKVFTKAEISHLREKAATANAAMADYNKFLGFLREQHEIAEDEKGWQLGERGFVRQVAPPLAGGTPPAREEGEAAA